MDDRTLRLAIVLLGVIVLLCVGGSLWLEAVGKGTPSVLSNLASSALGAIAGMLSQRPLDSAVKGKR